MAQAAARLGLGGFDPACKFFDLALSGVEPGSAEAVELLASFPEPQCLVQGCLAPLESVDDLLELALRLLETALLRQRVSSTRAPNPPFASSTSTRSPGETSSSARTISSCARTIA
jgi:hypothetical protein